MDSAGSVPAGGEPRPPRPPRLTTRYFIVQLGMGGVGQALVRHYLAGRDRWRDLEYAALGDRSGLCWIPAGWRPGELRAALRAKEAGESLESFAAALGKRAEFVPAPEAGLPEIDLVPDTAASHIVVDVTAERGSYDTLLSARAQGAHLVMCNKWTLAEPMERYDALLAAGTGCMFYETTVGAALPVIGPLDTLLETGDHVERIEAAISGTMGYVTTEIQRGVPFSEALGRARELGYTEPDARDDLAGVDARRKALILARKLGARIDMDDIQVTSLVPEGLEHVALDEFWRLLPESDAEYAARVAEAAERGSVLRFLATIDGSGASVGLREVALASNAGSLSGTESLFVFHTRRYGDQPLAIRGRGAGAEITAAGVLGDILQVTQY